MNFFKVIGPLSDYPLLNFPQTHKFLPAVNAISYLQSSVYGITSSKPEASNLSGVKSATYGTQIYIWKLISVTLGF